MLDFKTQRDKNDFFIALFVLALFGWFLYHFIFSKNETVDIDTLPVPTKVVEEISKDSDGDGISDKNDACPNVKGIAETNGCPTDADGDGVDDANDKCPSIKGSALNDGCPLDSDGDGISDNNDNCPNLAGVASNNGCPLDSDEDGVYDTVDKCPNRKGSAANGGCPEIEIEEAEAAILKKALESVEFETGSANLKPSSKRLLDDVASILHKYGAYKLDISGHTDNEGEAFSNRTLSKRRAEACKTYLMSKDIPSFRMETNGYGESRPLESNDTPEGKKKNRRVEFELHY
ncbi:MAG: OmpA family protein [Bacteroidota bacterium]